MRDFGFGNLMCVCSAMLIIPAQVSAAPDGCAKGRYLYEPVMMNEQRAEPVIQISSSQGANALPEERDLICAWPEIIGRAPPASVEIEQEERLGISTPLSQHFQLTPIEACEHGVLYLQARGVGK